MIQAAGITLRETVEAILVISIILVYLKKTGRMNMKKYVYFGTFGAIVASVIFAAALSAAGIDPENEVLEGTMLLTAAAFVATLMVWMWKASKTIKRDIERKIDKMAGGGSKFSPKFGLALIAFLLVFREGAETVIFMQSLALTGVSTLSNTFGGVLGIGLAIVFGVVFLKGTMRINLSKFFKITSGILAVLVISLVFRGLHEFFEVGLLPSNQTILSVAGFFGKTSTNALLISGMMTTLIGAVLYEVIKTPYPSLSGISGAEKRKKLYAFKKERFVQVSVGSTIILVVAILMVPAVISGPGVVDPTPVVVSAENQTINLDTAIMADGFYKYIYKTGGKDYEFLMLKQDNMPMIGLDRCYICPPLGYGYSETEGVLYCYNCDAPINVESIGTPGGCNPIVLTYAEENGIVTIRTEDLISAWAR